MKKPVFYSLVLILMLSPLLSAEENLFLPYDHKAYDQLANWPGRVVARPSPGLHTKYQSLTRYEIAFYLRNIIFRLKSSRVYPHRSTGIHHEGAAGEFDRSDKFGVDGTYLNRLFPVDFSTPEQDDVYQDLDIILNS